ncbi:hypothetical protein DQ04_01431130 [Trypanosoma grayi]|uniref:hypothetical protein n=1 Tax=Trypanosoma grayi TaxID=71804 RepID=UPI0004F49B8E|nr:hypothetical protein DQ04_01431130 [Trypanosoma grayi]KEG12784.1 hypothetical protein DQ04_01431130 [Trypanosoma grayi]
MTRFIYKAAFWVVHSVTHVVYICVPRFIQVLLGLWKSNDSKGTTQHIAVVAMGATTKTFFSLEHISCVSYTAPLYNGHISTVLCALRPPRPIEYTREIVNGVDGNPICLDWLLADTLTGSANGILIIIPGLASWSQTNYVQHYVWHAHEKGFHCCVFNTRGMGDTPLTQPRIMSATWTSDIRWVTHTTLTKAALSLRFGSAAAKVWAVGFSLGGIILSKFLAEEGEKTTQEHPFDAALIINSPLDALASSANMMLPKNALYQKNLTAGLLHYVHRHKEVVKYLPGIKEDSFRKDPVEFLKKIKTVRDFDKYINAPHNGFSSPEEYYSAVNALVTLRSCKIPMLCVITSDDPVTGEPPEEQLKDLVSANNFVAILEFPCGGHLGYIGTPADEWRGGPSIMEVVTTNICMASQRNEL